MKRVLSAIACAGLVVLSSAPANAWDGTVSGTVAALDVVAVDGENYGFRVYLDGAPTMCANSTATWGYINKSASNYEASVAILNSALLAGKSVTLYLTTVGLYCRIDYIVIRK